MSVTESGLPFRLLQNLYSSLHFLCDYLSSVPPYLFFELLHKLLHCLKSVCQGGASTETNLEYRFNSISIPCQKLPSDLPCPVGSKKSELFIPISAHTCSFIYYTFLLIYSGAMKFPRMSCWLSTLWVFIFYFLPELVVSISFSGLLHSSIHKLEIRAKGYPFEGYFLWHPGVIQVALFCSYGILGF